MCSHAGDGAVLRVAQVQGLNLRHDAREDAGVGDDLSIGWVFELVNK